MNISLRILLGYFLIVGVAGWFVLAVFMAEVKPGVRQAMEDTLVDTANVLARLAAPDLQTGRIQDGAFAKALQDVDRQRLDAQVWSVRKAHIDYRAYITDTHGIVVFDSARTDLGRDFSRWNDVRRTLHGHYGARSTRSDPADAASSVMHVAAPIRDGTRLLGVLTVAKPNRTVEPFIARSQRKILMAGLWLLGVSLAIGVLFSLWITGSLRQLLRYAERVSQGEKAEPPALGSSELARLSRALAGMREKLEGKQYVERYVQTLTHEMKTPLTAIRGAAELLGEDLPTEQRELFAANVLEQTERMHQLVERMLELASVESRQRLEQVAPVAMQPLVEELLAARGSQIAKSQLTLDAKWADCSVQGDRFLLGQAIGNLLDNAIDFSPQGGRLDVALTLATDTVTVTVADSGDGVPDYAQPRVFERFYSLPRPATGRKSTGLGLPFVREVSDLHRGEVTLANRPERGAVATLVLPLTQVR